MTIIGKTTQTITTQGYGGGGRSGEVASFADHLEQGVAQSNEPQSGKLTSLLAQLDGLKQVNMSNRDYLLASFALKEQIATERLNAEEDLDTFAVRFEGRVFNLAGKRYGSEFLEFAKVCDADIMQLATPHGPGVGSYQAQRQVGIDIEA